MGSATPHRGGNAESEHDISFPPPPPPHTGWQGARAPNLHLSSPLWEPGPRLCLLWQVLHPPSAPQTGRSPLEPPAQAEPSSWRSAVTEKVSKCPVPEGASSQLPPLPALPMDVLSQGSAGKAGQANTPGPGACLGAGHRVTHSSRVPSPPCHPSGASLSGRVVGLEPSTHPWLQPPLGIQPEPRGCCLETLHPPPSSA